MSLLDWFGKKKPPSDDLGKRIDDLETRVSRLETGMHALEQRFTDRLDSKFGDYASKSKKELQAMNVQIDEMIGTMNSMMSAIEDEAHIKRAKQLLQRLKNNRTRILAALAA